MCSGESKMGGSYCVGNTHPVCFSYLGLLFVCCCGLFLFVLFVLLLLFFLFFLWGMPRLHESGPFQGSYGQSRETTQHLLGPI